MRNYCAKLKSIQLKRSAHDSADLCVGKRKQNTADRAASLGSATILPGNHPQNYLFAVPGPRIIIALAVVGIAESLSQGSGVREVVVIT